MAVLKLYFALESCGGLVRHCPQFLLQYVGGTREFAFLTRSQVMLILLVLGPHSKNHYFLGCRCSFLLREGELIAEAPFSFLRSIASSKQT